MNRLIKKLLRYNLIGAFLICYIFTISYASILENNYHAGNGNLGYSDGMRLDAEFRFPYGIALDNEKNLIVADSYNNVIRKISGDEVHTIAGVFDSKDLKGFPIGGLIDEEVNKARFNRPRNITVDSKGRILVVDTENNVIRRIIDGKVFTYAGIGVAGYKDGKIYEAQFNKPSGIAIDSKDNIYVADTMNHVIRKITPNGNVTTFAGIKTDEGGYKDGNINEAIFTEPSDVDIDRAGNLYILDTGNQLIRKIMNDRVFTIAGNSSEKIVDTNYTLGGDIDGFGPESRFNFPKGFEVTDSGLIFVADTWNHKIRVIRQNGEVITLNKDYINQAASNQVKYELNGPVDIVLDSDILYISDMWNNSIYKMTLDMEKLTTDPAHEIRIWIDGEEVIFSDEKPYIEKGKTMVPLKVICEKLDLQVNGLDDTKTVAVKKGKWEKVLTYNIDPVTIKDYNAMIHIRYLAEALGYFVDWVPDYKWVIIQTAK